MASLRSSLGTRSTVPLIVIAQGILESTAAPFAQGDYGAAMDRAAQAEALIALAAHEQVRPGRNHGSPGEVPLQVAIPLKVTVDSKLRRQPFANAAVIGVLKKDSPLVAHAYKGPLDAGETDDGRSGWLDQMHLGAQ